ncbi:hypothetical protein JOQ06_017643, partial [Pogonophryne albipinna]
MFYSYMRILRVCFSGSKQTRQKALSTCTPHLVSLFNFSFGGFFEIIQSRYLKNFIGSPAKISWGQFGAAFDKHVPCLLKLYRARKGAFGQKMEDLLEKLDEK